MNALLVGCILYILIGSVATLVFILALNAFKLQPYEDEMKEEL
jgi:hypothetical protein